MRGSRVLLSAAALFAALALTSAPTANAQVFVGIGVQPVCSWGYYDYAPYACAPYGFYGPGYFYDGIFLGMGPWANWGYSHGWGGHRFSGGGGGRYIGGGGRGYSGARASTVSRGGAGRGSTAQVSRSSGVARSGGSNAVAAHSSVARSGGAARSGGGGGGARGGGGRWRSRGRWRWFAWRWRRRSSLIGADRVASGSISFNGIWSFGTQSSASSALHLTSSR